MSPISAATVKLVIQPNPGAVYQDRHVAMIGARALQLGLDLANPPLEIVDQRNARVDV